jgi:tetratricopeptide (TPR) repeat protein
MKNISLIVSFFMATFIFGLGPNLHAQCETWNNHPMKDEAEGAHSIYRQALKTENYKLAFENWETAYSIAPAADGKRDFHYMDGVKLYKWKYKNTNDKEQKKKIIDSVNMLYEQAAQCYQEQAILVSRCQGKQACYDAKAGYVLGRKAYDMYYTFNMPRMEIFKTIKKSIELAGNQSEYIIFDPMASSIATLYDRGEITAEQARDAHQQLIAIAEYNIENNKQYGKYYEQSQKSMNNKLAKVEDDLYDCQYFMDKLLPLYQENPTNDSIVERVYVKLRQKDCDSSLPIMQELKMKYKKYIDEYNKKIQQELAAKNPAYAAKLLYDEGKYQEAIAKYDEALAETDSAEDKADIYFRQASILGRKLKRYSSARAKARKAASLKDNWGRPYLLIGDLYASSNCGDAWNKRLAILAALDKYAYAKSIDPSVANEANRRMATYSGSKPLQQEAFMRGYKKGEKVKVGCWIGETVSLRFSKG